MSDLLSISESEGLTEVVVSSEKINYLEGLSNTNSIEYYKVLLEMSRIMCSNEEVPEPVIMQHAQLLNNAIEGYTFSKNLSLENGLVNTNFPAIHFYYVKDANKYSTHAEYVGFYNFDLNEIGINIGKMITLAKTSLQIARQRKQINDIRLCIIKVDEQIRWHGTVEDYVYCLLAEEIDHFDWECRNPGSMKSYIGKNIPYHLQPHEVHGFEVQILALTHRYQGMLDHEPYLMAVKCIKAQIQNTQG